MIKIAVLIGRGGRLKAIYECIQKLGNKVELSVVISHKKESPGIDFAKNQNIESFYFRITDWKAKGNDRESYMKELASALKERKIDLVVMAGWDLVMSNLFLKEFPMRVMNIHPSLTPAFPGLEAPKQAMEYGAKVTGATLHFVPDEGVDTGQVIFQEAVKIEDDDTVETLEDKIHQVEEKILCRGITAFVEGKIEIKGRKVFVKK